MIFKNISGILPDNIFIKIKFRSIMTIKQVIAMV